jgi:transcription antitermination protein NusB
VSARSKARKQALDLLYETDIRGTNLVETLNARDIPADAPDARPIRDYTKELVNGVSDNRRKIDELITTYAQGWDMDRLPAVDRNILRLGIYEVLWSSDVPTSVAIDEALILAKELSSDDSSKYIHGVLGRIASIKDTISI